MGGQRIRRWRLAVSGGSVSALLVTMALIGSPTPASAADGGAPELVGVSCASTSSCVSVGYQGAPKISRPFAEESKGATTTIITPVAPVGSQSTFLEAVSCASTQMCMAVGYWVTSAEQWQPLSELWNGSEWQLEAVPTTSGANPLSNLVSVSCPTTTWCMAVSVRFSDSWDGHSWTVHPEPIDPNAVSCSAVNVCMEVSRLGASWDGRKWTENSALSGYMTSVSCASATACVAVGNEGVASPIAEVWNGTSWALSAPVTVGLETSLSAVSCASPTACMAVGRNGKTVVESWDGSSWAVQPSVNEGEQAGLFAVSCPTASSCLAVGYREAPGYVHSLAEHWNGLEWQLRITPAA